LNLSAIGQAVTYTAVVTGQNGVVPVGTVTFNVSLNKPVVVSLVNRQPTYTIAYQLAGPRTVTATYSGDSNIQARVSTTIN